MRELQQLPAYALQYPGATLLHTGATPPQPTLAGGVGAQVFETFCMHTPVPAEVTPKAILDWYT